MWKPVTPALASKHPAISLMDYYNLSKSLLVHGK
jgi:hypothetical protein